MRPSVAGSSPVHLLHSYPLDRPMGKTGTPLPKIPTISILPNCQTTKVRYGMDQKPAKRKTPGREELIPTVTRICSNAYPQIFPQALAHPINLWYFPPREKRLPPLALQLACRWVNESVPEDKPIVCRMRCKRARELK
jgi:hypothetical protein